MREIRHNGFERPSGGSVHPSHVPGTFWCLLWFLSLLASGCEKVSSTTRQQLNSPDSAVRYRAAEELSIIESPEATRLLISALADTDRGVRMVAAESLGTRKAKEATALLIKTLRDEDMWVRAHAADALGDIGAKAALKPLAELVSTLSITNSRKRDMLHPWADVEAAGFALHRITGENFGLDGPKWKQWLATQKPLAD
jgi:hypothetical protein